jgi:hypothetical protein
MMRSQRSVILIFGIFFTACVVAFGVLNRWLITDIGLASYGRIWQLYISYSDFGFVRRALVGTVLTESGINSLFKNEYHSALAIHHIAIAVLASVIAFYCTSRKITNPLFLVSIAFSPALIIHSGYSTGSLDVFILILAAVNILFVRSSILFSFIIVVGVVAHELFIFTVPAQFLALLIRRGKMQNVDTVKTFAAPAVALIGSAIAITIFGTVDLPRETVEQIMRQKIPIAAGQHPLWSGYFEIASTAENNAVNSLQYLAINLRTGFIWLLIPLTYLAFLIARLWTYSERPIEAAAIVISVLAPLLTALVANDYYRWVAMSANMGILLALVYAAQTGRSDSRWNIPLLIFCLLAPFGSFPIDRPFPMHQFVLEKFMN